METKTKQQEMYLCAGIDVSKDTLDVHYNNARGEHHLKVENNLKGYRQLLKLVGKDYHYVMESTGPYCLNVAFYLKQKECKVSVENALVVKRFIQMNKERNKSDRKDAKWIFQYGVLQRPKEWNQPTRIYLECVQLQSAIEMLTRQYTMIGNLLHSMEHTPVQSKQTAKVLHTQHKQIHKQISILEKELTKNIQSWVPEQLENLLTIPGMGKRTASQLIVFTDGFSKINNYRQLISLAGLSPREFNSGTSVRARVRICKMGGVQIRKLLYMCSMTAIKNNKTCKQLYERIKAKGKNGKLALIAVCNKLLKQAFAIAKNGTRYNENYISTILVND
jgi:transposase